MPTNTNYSDIQAYFKGKTIFVTGATGFAGKSLIHRILQTCQVNTIYILLRAKRGQSFDQRLESYFNEDIFNYFDNKFSCLGKIKAIEGDVAMPRLNLSSSDYRTLVENVDLVFHGAATIKLNEALRRATKINVYGTQQVIELCRAMVHLDCLIHLSTFSAWCFEDVLGEQVYQLDNGINVNTFLTTMDTMSVEEEKIVHHRYIGDRPKYPNSYILAKTMAEVLLRDSGHDLKVAIVRLPFLVHALKQPCPGWFDQLQTMIAMFCIFTTGFVRIGVKLDVRPQGLPVDVASNALMAIAWDFMGNFNAHKLKVYNAVPRVEDMLSLKDIQRYAVKCVHRYPSIRQIFAPPELEHSWPIILLYLVTKPFIIVGALVGDLVLLMNGKKRRLSRMASNLMAGMEEIKVAFKFNKWSVDVDVASMQAMYGSDGCLSSHDKDTYYYDLTNYWNDREAYFLSLYMHFRRKVLNEPDSNVEMARKRFNRIQVFYRVIRYALNACMAYSVMSWIIN